MKVLRSRMKIFDMSTDILLIYRIKISHISTDISPIYRISVIFDTISAIDNRLKEKSTKNW